MTTMFQYAKDYDQELVPKSLLNDIEDYLNESPIESDDRMKQRTFLIERLKANRGKVFTQ